MPHMNKEQMCLHVTMLCHSVMSKCVIVCTPSFLLERVQPPTKFSKREGLTGPQFLEVVAGKEILEGGRGRPFSEGCNF